jgi:hypothetical protein
MVLKNIGTPLAEASEQKSALANRILNLLVE